MSEEIDCVRGGSLLSQSQGGTNVTARGPYPTIKMTSSLTSRSWQHGRTPTRARAAPRDSTTSSDSARMHENDDVGRDGGTSSMDGGVKADGPEVAAGPPPGQGFVQPRARAAGHVHDDGIGTSVSSSRLGQQAWPPPDAKTPPGAKQTAHSPRVPNANSSFARRQPAWHTSRASDERALPGKRSRSWSVRRLEDGENIPVVRTGPPRRSLHRECSQRRQGFMARASFFANGDAGTGRVPLRIRRVKGAPINRICDE